MADEIAQPVVEAAAPAPAVVETAPVVVAESAPAVVTEAAPAPVTEAAPVAEAPKADSEGEKVTAETPTLLQEIGKEEAKPATEEPKKEGTVEEKLAVEAEPAPEPIKYELNFPETLAADDKVKTEVSELFNEARVPPELGQKFVDFYDTKAAEYRDHLHREQVNTFNQTRAGWRKEVRNDPELGGAGYETTMGAIARVRDLAVPAAEREAFNKFCDYTGAGDNPAFLKMMHRLVRYLDEPKPMAPDPKPVPQGRQPGQRRSAVLYDKSNGAAKS